MKTAYYVIFKDDMDLPPYGPFSNRKAANKWISEDYGSIIKDSETSNYALIYLVVQVKDIITKYRTKN